MAHLWIRWQHDPRDEGEASGPEWAVAPLADDVEAFVLTDDVRQPVRLRDRIQKAPIVAQILRVGDRQQETWVLHSPEKQRIRVNGFPLVAGIRVLQDRDEIMTPSMGRMYFSSEREPKVEPFPGREQATPCPRCKGLIVKGEPSVQCPQCRTWHHQTDEMCCWTYSERCTLCDQPARLETGFRWTPENL